MNLYHKAVGYLYWKFGLFKYRAKMILENPKPEEIKKNIVYIVGGKNYVKWAYLKCPDCCGETILLSLVSNKGPSWKIKQDKKGRVTRYPSIFKQDGCRSHFFIIDGNLVWLNNENEEEHKEYFNVIGKQADTFCSIKL